MTWETIYNDRKVAIAQRSPCGLYQIAKYASSPRYCLFKRETIGTRFEVLACGDDADKLRKVPLVGTGAQSVSSGLG